MPDYLSAVDTAAKWGISKRRVTLLCVQGRIPGATIISRDWLIPADAEKPPDQRINNGKYIRNASERKRNKKIMGKGGEEKQDE